MCKWLNKLAVLFNSKKTPPPLILPHPEEVVNPLATMENTDIKQVVAKWLADWQVPSLYQWIWQSVDIKLSLKYDYPAATFAEDNRIYIRPEWANPGVLSHEMAHISYSLLSIEQKAAFINEYKALLVTDKLLDFLYKTKPNMKQNSIEAHADIYRFLGAGMPQTLKGFYPNLL